VMMMMIVFAWLSPGFSSILFHKPGCAGTDCDDNGRSKSYSFSTPIHSARRGSSMLHANLTQRDRGKCNGRSSSSFSRDRYTVPSGDNLRSESGGRCWIFYFLHIKEAKDTS
jgi:hypothetical protein